MEHSLTLSLLSMKTVQLDCLNKQAEYLLFCADDQIKDSDKRVDKQEKLKLIRKKVGICENALN